MGYKTKDGREVVSIFCDASHCPKLFVGGWGFWFKSDRHERRGGGPLQSEVVKDSSEAEMMAVANSLYVGVSEGWIPEKARVVFGIDNQWVVNVLNGNTKIKVGERPATQAAFDFIRKMGRQYKLDLRFRKVKAHNPDGGGRCRVNEVADYHAREGLAQARAQKGK